MKAGGALGSQESGFHAPLAFLLTMDQAAVTQALTSMENRLADTTPTVPRGVALFF